MEDPHRPRPFDRIGDRYRPILIPAIGPKMGDRSLPITHTPLTTLCSRDMKSLEVMHPFYSWNALRCKLCWISWEDDVATSNLKHRNMTKIADLCSMSFSNTSREQPLCFLSGQIHICCKEAGQYFSPVYICSKTLNVKSVKKVAKIKHLLHLLTHLVRQHNSLKRPCYIFCAVQVSVHVNGLLRLKSLKTSSPFLH